MYINKAILFGNLTRDPERRMLPSGVAVTSFSLATNRVWRNKEGARQEDTQYHNVVCFGRQAESVAQYLRRGSSVFIEGRMQTRSWDAQDGTKKYRTEVVADTVQFGPRREGDARGTAPADDGVPQVGGEEGGSIQYPSEESNPDDIPF